LRSSLVVSDLESWDKGLLGVSLVRVLAFDFFLEDFLVRFDWFSSLICYSFFFILEAAHSLPLANSNGTASSKKDENEKDNSKLALLLLLFFLVVIFFFIRCGDLFLEGK